MTGFLQSSRNYSQYLIIYGTLESITIVENIVSNTSQRLTIIGFPNSQKLFPTPYATATTGRGRRRGINLTTTANGNKLPLQVRNQDYTSSLRQKLHSA